MVLNALFCWGLETKSDKDTWNLGLKSLVYGLNPYCCALAPLRQSTLTKTLSISADQEHDLSKTHEVAWTDLGQLAKDILGFSQCKGHIIIIIEDFSRMWRKK